METSPRWSATTKLIVMLAILAVVGFFLVRFQVLIPPLIMAVILAYLLNPIVTAMTKRLRFSRMAAVLAVYAVLILVLLGLASGAGLLLQQQFSGVLATVMKFLNSIPGWIDSLSAHPLSIGPFTFDFSSADVTLVQDALIPTARDWIGGVTEWMTGAASDVAAFLGWTVFTFLVAYYMLHDLDALEQGLLRIVPEEYKKDAGRLLDELGPIWNSFLRGQLLLSLIMGLAIGSAMALMGVRYALVLGLMAAVAEFIPIIGANVTGATAVLIAFFQTSNWLGIPPLPFAVAVGVISGILQQLESNFLIPRVMGDQLKLHPAILIVGALAGFSLMGIPGLLLAGPIIATARLFGKYVYAKLFNLPPWPAPAEALLKSPPRIRPARQADKRDMLDLTALMWEGHDYVPDVWNEWLADRKGSLAAAEVNGRMVGFGKLSRLGEREWWLEGLRVHPEYQGMKISSQLAEYLIGEWKRKEGGVIRLATSSERKPVHHLCSRLGFRRAGECRIMTAEPVEHGECEFQPVSRSEAKEAAALFPSRAAWKGSDLVNEHWRWSRFSADRLAGFIQRKRAWWWRGRTAFLLAYDSKHDGQPSLEVAAVIAPMDAVTPMLQQARTLARRRKARRIAWVMPDDSRLAKAAQRAGFALAWDARLWIFERSDPPAGSSSKKTEVAHG